MIDFGTAGPSIAGLANANTVADRRAALLQYIKPALLKTYDHCSRRRIECMVHPLSQQSRMQFAIVDSRQLLPVVDSRRIDDRGVETTIGHNGCIWLQGRLGQVRSRRTTGKRARRQPQQQGSPIQQPCVWHRRHLVFPYQVEEEALIVQRDIPQIV